MTSLIYVSSAVQLFTALQLQELLVIWRRKNTAAGISGLLLYKDGNFMQVIEGEKEQINDLWQRMNADPRHTGLLKLLEEKISERSFPDWSMGFRDLGDSSLQEVEGYRNYRDISLLSAEFSTKPSRAKKLLEDFRQRM